MTKYNKKGAEILDMQLRAQKKRQSLDIIYVVDTDVSELLREVLEQLKQVNEYLSKFD